MPSSRHGVSASDEGPRPAERARGEYHPIRARDTLDVSPLRFGQTRSFGPRQTPGPGNNREDGQWICGIGLFSGNILARTVAVIIASISLVWNLFFIPVYPLWAVTVITIDALVIWALTAHGREMREA